MGNLPAPKYRVISLELDSQGLSQTKDQKIARITTMFQQGLIAPQVATVAIRALERGVYITEVETTMLQLDPLANVVFERDVHQEREAADAEKVKAQGLAPRSRHILEPGMSVTSESVKPRPAAPDPEQMNGAGDGFGGSDYI